MGRGGGKDDSQVRKLQAPGPEEKPLSPRFLFESFVEGEIAVTIVADYGMAVHGAVPPYLMGSSGA